MTKPKQQKTHIDWVASRLTRIIERYTATPKNNPEIVNYALRPYRGKKDKGGVR